jgi:hypothetical protein
MRQATMKRSMLIAGVTVLVVWLGLWAASTGVLVYSSSMYSSSTRVPSTRDCRYLVGVSVQKRFERRVQRCPFFREVRR